MIVKYSGYLNNLLPGGVVLADWGFDVADSVAMLGATLDIPAFTRGCGQLAPSDVEARRKLANIRIHVERIISITFFNEYGSSCLMKETFSIYCGFSLESSL